MKEKEKKLSYRESGSVMSHVGTDCDASLKKHYTGDDLQNKCIKLFFEALRVCPLNTDDERNATKSAEIVSCIVKLGKLTDSKFVRSKLLNLRDKGNLQLSNDVYDEMISCTRFVEMTLEEMKSESLKKMENDMHKKCLLDIQLAEPQAEIGMFECSKCKQRKCSYFQMQTRSADEPMTTYVRCVCGHRWKFS